jgi:hypothetical protein
LALASAAALLAADQLLFRIATFDGCALTPSYANDRDLEWWQQHVGALPQYFDDIDQPNAISGRPGTWWHPRGGHGAAGASGTPLEAESGVAAFDMTSDSRLVTGRALATNERWSYSVGSTLPLQFMERVYIGPAGTDPGHPVTDRGPNGWSTRFRIGPFAVDLLLLMVAVDYLCVWFHRIRGVSRVRRSACAQCGYSLLPDQHRCPECGAPVAPG